MKKDVKIFLTIILILIIILFLIRLTNSTQIDDAHPEIPCPELEKYNPDVLYVIPNFNEKSISENESWCKYILSLNKTLEMHGINHQPYREFLTENITQEKIDFAISEFQKCFNQTPQNFKPPQLKISEQNKILVKKNNLTLNLFGNGLFHKVYHCNDTGSIKNKWIKIF